MATTPEGRVKNAIKAWLKKLPGCWFFMPIGGPYSVQGIPDFIGCIRGRLFAIEAKRGDGKGRLTALQEAVISAIQKAGGLAFMAQSLDEVQAAFAAEGLIGA